MFLAEKEIFFPAVSHMSFFAKECREQPGITFFSPVVHHKHRGKLFRSDLENRSPENLSHLQYVVFNKAPQRQNHTQNIHYYLQMGPYFTCR